MNFFPDERAAELRELFFESAEELLQQLNEAGLHLEAHPGDAEVMRNVRRVIHTLKGDSAACGFRELSTLAHELEDALDPQSHQSMHNAIVDIVFTAADTFREMLTAYRRNVQPSTGNELRSAIRRVFHSHGHQRTSNQSPDSAPQFAWSQDQRARIDQALAHRERVYNIALTFDPASGMRSAAFHMALNVLRNLGQVLALDPPDAAAAQNSTRMEAALISEYSIELLQMKCKIPSVISNAHIEEISNPAQPAQDLLDVVLEAEARASAAASAPQQSARGSDSISRQLDMNLASQTHPTLRVDANRIDAVLNLIGELIIGKSMLHRTLLEFDKHHPKDPLRSRFADALAIQSRVLEELQRSVMKIRMVPVEQLFRRFPRIVRDAAKACGREVAVEMAGETTDLDKSILDALAEPMAHLIRNAVSHGIEPPHERESLGKPSKGIVRVNAYHQANQMVIEISDDGRGIDVKKVLHRAIENGSISASESERLSHADAMQLIFLPGVSTADEITETSGRGVGMDVVAGALERLKGVVDIESTPGAGTKFRLTVPLTLASIQALLFRISGTLYAAPLSNVVEITRIAGHELHTVDNRTVLRLRDQLLTVARLPQPYLHEVAPKKAFVVVIAAGDRKFGLIVDSLVGEEELVVKSLDDPMSASNIVSGASILGDGGVVLILNIAAVAAQIGRSAPLGAIA